MNYLRKAFNIFRAAPIAFSLIIVLGVLSVIDGNVPAALILLALLVWQARIVVLQTQLKVLKVVATAGLVAAMGAAFNE
jgi:hypothetical protein